jgi:hypothetical protein
MGRRLSQIKADKGASKAKAQRLLSMFLFQKSRKSTFTLLDNKHLTG